MLFGFLRNMWVGDSPIDEEEFSDKLLAWQLKPEGQLTPCILELCWLFLPLWPFLIYEDRN